MNVSVNDPSHTAGSRVEAVCTCIVSGRCRKNLILASGMHRDH